MLANYVSIDILSEFSQQQQKPTFQKRFLFQDFKHKQPGWVQEKASTGNGNKCDIYITRSARFLRALNHRIIINKQLESNH